MDLQLDGCAAVVTGASRGLGWATVRTLVQEGVRVLAVARNLDALESLAEEAPQSIRFQSCDMCDRGAVATLADRAIEAFGRLDLVVNNAGIGGGMPFLDQDFNDWDQMMAINVTAPAALSQAAGRHFATQRSGKIINIASTTSIRGIKNLVSYCTSKGAILQLTKALAIEWAPMGVQVNAIGPGASETSAQRVLLEGPQEQLDARLSRIPHGRMGQPSEVGALACYLASPLADHITGALYMIDGGESIKL